MDSDIDRDEEQEGRNPLRDRMKQLEAENAELKARADESSAAAQELAFMKAGVDPNLPISKYFMKGYDGELNADAIREAAIEAELIRDAQADQVKAEAGTWDRSTQMAADSSNEPPVDWGQRISQAKTSEVEALLAEAKAAQQIWPVTGAFPEETNMAYTQASSLSVDQQALDRIAYWSELLLDADVASRPPAAGSPSRSPFSTICRQRHPHRNVRRHRSCDVRRVSVTLAEYGNAVTTASSVAPRSSMSTPSRQRRWLQRRYLNRHCSVTGTNYATGGSTSTRATTIAAEDESSDDLRKGPPNFGRQRSNIQRNVHGLHPPRCFL